MSKIDELINRLCPSGVEFKKIAELCNSLKKGTLKTSELDENGKYPVINSGRELYGYYNEYNNKNAVVVASRGEYAGFISYFKEEFWAGGLCYPYSSKNENIITNKFLYYYLKNNEKKIMENLVARGSIPALNKSDFDKFNVPVPPLEVQCEIVHILDDFTLLSAELSAELKARQKQYEYYKNHLFDFEENVQYDTMENICEIITDYVANGSFGDIAKNVSYKNEKDYAVLLRTVDYSNGFNPDKFIYIDEHAYNYLKKSKLYGGEIIINNVGAGVGTTFLCPNLDMNMSLAPNTVMLRTNNNKYYYYWLNSKFGQEELRKITSKSAMPKFNKTGFRKIKVPIVSEEKQNEIVNILDKFEKICNDISEGLPAEIEARQKQYEYYRDKLLTFKELKSE